MTLAISANIEYNQLVRIVQEQQLIIAELERRTSFNADNWSGGVTNLTIDKTFDANAATLAELRNVLGTLIKDLLEAGVLK